jgi:hypothetical protein
LEDLVAEATEATEVTDEAGVVKEVTAEDGVGDVK